MTPPTLPEFILARVAEDEAVARAAIAGRPWADEQWPLEVYDDGVRNVAVAFSPARVMAQCAAIRAVVELHWRERYAGSDKTYCVECQEGYGYSADTDEVCPTLRHLAAIWADHPDRRQEWAVTGL